MITLSEVYDRLLDLHSCEEEMCGCGIHLLLADVMGSLPSYQREVVDLEKEVSQLREQFKSLRESIIADAFKNHIEQLHLADYEVCENLFCKFTYALEHNNDGVGD